MGPKFIVTSSQVWAANLTFLGNYVLNDYELQICMVTETFGSMELNSTKFKRLSSNRGWNRIKSTNVQHVNAQCSLKCHDSNINFIEFES